MPTNFGKDDIGLDIDRLEKIFNENIKKTQELVDILNIRIDKLSEKIEKLILSTRELCDK